MENSRVDEISQGIQLNGNRTEDGIMWIRASNLAEAINSIRPAAAHKYDIVSLLVAAAEIDSSGDDGGKESESALVGIEALQDRLFSAVLQPYTCVDDKTVSRHKFVSPAHCSGKLLLRSIGNYHTEFFKVIYIEHVSQFRITYPWSLWMWEVLCSTLAGTQWQETF
jgi:hypothetical protein